MFNKIKCVCGKKISKKVNYCPHCGTPISEIAKFLEEKKLRDKTTDAMLKEFEKSFGIPSIMHFPFKQLVKQLSKDIEKQFREFDQELQKEDLQMKSSKNAKKEKQKIIQQDQEIGNINTYTFPGGFSIQIKIGGQSEPELEKEPEERLPETPTKKFSEKDQEKYAKLPKKEPATKVRRFSNKIVYEIEMPGIKNKKDVIINRLQNSIEIKAFAKDKAYFKLIPVSLPIKNWKFSKEKLVLELQP